MKISHSAVPRLRLAVVLAFVGTCALFFLHLWTNMGGTIPVVSSDGYRVTFETRDADNLVYDSDVRVAGVRVGKVRELEEEGGVARVVVQLDEDSAMPLHEGARIHLRSKSLIEETYVEIVDGDGAELPDGSTLPASAVVKSVQLDDVLNSLDEPTRRSLSSAVQSLGEATGQTHEELDQTLTGLGRLGREGYDVLDALADQSDDLRALVARSGTVLRALDTGQGRIVDLVEGADRLASATAANRSEVESTVRRLPGVLDSASSATVSLTELAGDLRPVTADLVAAAPSLNRALIRLPATTRDLRALLPSLDSTLGQAPATLRRVPDVAAKTRRLVPTTRATLADLNPMLAFLKPYGRDLAAWLSNWTAMLANKDVNGHYLRIFPVFNEQSVKNSPLRLNYSVLNKSNAYPAPGESSDPGPFRGTYPRVERDPE